MRRSALAVPLLALPLLLSSPAPALAAEPRPGCGYGDENHAHQAAPGRDPKGLRPGAGKGDGTRHTAPPGQAPDGAGDQSSPRRGCTAQEG